MIAIDTNILVYAHREDAPFHAEARRCIAMLRTGQHHWALPWPAVHEFIATVTSGRRLLRPTQTADALSVNESLRLDPNCQFIGEGPSHLAILRRLLFTGKAVGGRSTTLASLRSA